ncbi:hypothetical protein IFM89_018245 [Coptis chinensis]|uniref:Uncharacterized protein n=1 Tax=Coptis chinensis TaxID=261450 RepID=A0A835IAA0_9MAGN|nr:hypothetical protein IFM89_018245 [Coptis chinensis]
MFSSSSLRSINPTTRYTKKTETRKQERNDPSQSYNIITENHVIARETIAVIMQATHDFLLHGPRGGKTNLRSYLKRKLKLSLMEEDIGEEEDNKKEHEHSSEDESQQAPNQKIKPPPLKNNPLSEMSQEQTNCGTEDQLLERVYPRNTTTNQNFIRRSSRLTTSKRNHQRPTLSTCFYQLERAKVNKKPRVAEMDNKTQRVGLVETFLSRNHRLQIMLPSIDGEEVTNGNVSTEPTIDLNFGAAVLQLDTMEVEPDNVQMKTFDSQPEVEQLEECNKLSGREDRAAKVCLDKLLEVMSVYMESLYATVGETPSDRSLTSEEKIYVLASNMSWSLRLSFKELLEENTHISSSPSPRG